MTATMYGSGGRWRHRTGGGYLTTWTPQLVVDAPDPVNAFAEFAQQRLGVPWPTQRDMAILRKKIGEFFDHYPRLTFHTLCRVVEWARQRRWRFDRVWKVIDAFRRAWTDGAIPELDPAQQRDERLDASIAQALESETDPVWRRWLIGAEGEDARRKVLEDWRAERVTGGVH